MASGIGNYLRAEIDRRGWSDRHFAKLAGLRPSALSYILITPGAVPRLDTLDRIAAALDMELDTLIIAAGFTLRGGDEAARQQRVALVAAAVPEVQRLLDDAVGLPPKKLRAVQAYVDRVVEEIQEELKRGPDTP